MSRPGEAAAPAAARRGRAAARLDRVADARGERAGESSSFDPVRMYLKEIGKVPLLTAQQEVTLAKRLEAGIHAAERLAAADDPLADPLAPVERFSPEDAPGSTPS